MAGWGECWDKHLSLGPGDLSSLSAWAQTALSPDIQHTPSLPIVWRVFHANNQLLSASRHPAIQFIPETTYPELVQNPPRVQGSAPQDHPHLRYQSQVQAVTCASDQPALSEDFA